MKTSYFGRMNSKKYKHLKNKGISIARYAKYWDGDSYPSLYPSWDMINLAHEKEYSKESYEEYKRLYYDQVLDKLDPAVVYNDLKDSILLCHETKEAIDKKTKFCHRRLVANWLIENLNVKVEELE